MGGGAPFQSEVAAEATSHFLSVTLSDGQKTTLKAFRGEQHVLALLPTLGKSLVKLLGTQRLMLPSHRLQL